MLIKCLIRLGFLSGGSGENRTLTPVRIHDFESCASTNSATEPEYFQGSKF